MYVRKTNHLKSTWFDYPRSQTNDLIIELFALMCEKTFLYLAGRQHIQAVGFIPLD